MMKKVLLKFLLVIASLLLQFNLLAQDVSRTIHVATAGTLSNFIAVNEKYQITNLTLTGNLNGTDIRFIREMAGSDYIGNTTPGQLANLNLAGINIDGGASAGAYYYDRTFEEFYYTSGGIISAYMFYNCSLLTSITIPDNAFFIENRAFQGCTGLTEIHCNRLTPPETNAYVSGLYIGVFRYVDKKTCKLYVPKGSKSAYQTASEWRDFLNIIEMDYTSIIPTEKDNITVHSIANGISIETKEQMSVSVYNLSGQKVYQSIINGNTEINLRKGVYIVCANNENRKVIVK